MVDSRAQGRRKSQFPAQTSVPSGSTFDYVSGGVNYKITFENLIASLGVTGTIVQDGADDGVPVLDTQGSVNNIRNIEPGAGIKAQVSPENGISLSSGIKQSASGVKIFDDLTLNEPTAASLIAGDGAIISKDGNEITIATTEGLANRVVVRTKADLAGTLDPTKEYFIDGIIDMEGQSIEVPAGGLNLSGYDFNVSKLISSVGGYTMFTSPVGGSGDLLGKDYAIEVTGAGSQVYNLVSATGFDAFEFARINYNNCSSLGTIDGYRQGLESGTGRFGGSPNMILKGAWAGGYFIDTSIVRVLDAGFTGALYEAGAGFTMASRFRSNQNIDLPASASFFDFAQANFPNPSTLQLDGCIITRNGASDATDPNITPNITAAELAASWSNNQGIPNTFEGGTLTITVATATIISATSTFVDLDGTFTPSDLQHFDEPANGQLRHLGNNPREYRVVGSVVIEGPANDDVALKLVKWDDSASAFVDVFTQTRDINNLVGGTNRGFFDFNFPVVLDQNDYVKFQVANNSTTGNLTGLVDSFFNVIER